MGAILGRGRHWARWVRVGQKGRATVSEGKSTGSVKAGSGLIGMMPRGCTGSNGLGAARVRQDGFECVRYTSLDLTLG